MRALILCSLVFVHALGLSGCGPVDDTLPEVTPEPAEVAEETPLPDEYFPEEDVGNVQQANCGMTLTGCVLGAISVVAGAAVTVSCVGGTAVTTLGTLTASCYLPATLTGAGAAYTMMACSAATHCGSNIGPVFVEWTPASVNPTVVTMSTTQARQNCPRNEYFSPYRTDTVQTCTTAAGATMCTSSRHYPCVATHTHGSLAYNTIRSGNCVRVNKKAVRCDGGGPTHIGACGSAVSCGRVGLYSSGVYEE